MASATVDSPSDRLGFDSIPVVDLRLLSQSELLALSLCSDDAYNLRRCDDVVIPKIDRSVFNESAGSRKQTYSRLRLAPRNPTILSVAGRTPRLPISKSPALPATDDPEKEENTRIIGMLKTLFAGESHFDDLLPVEVEYSKIVPNESDNLVNCTVVCQNIPLHGSDSVQKRRRGRPRKYEKIQQTNGIACDSRKDIVFLENTVKAEDLDSKDVVLFDHGLNAGDRKRKRGRPRKHEKALYINGDGGGTIKNITVSEYGLTNEGRVVEKVLTNECEALVISKRGRPRKYEKAPQISGHDGYASKEFEAFDNGLNSEDRAMEVMNKNGVIVDFGALANLEDPFGPELKRRTSGLETEADLLGFLTNLNGHWGSRRRKRRIVDASDFGDVLPLGWKLLLSLKRKQGRTWLICRRYISPNGRQFVSCKEVSSFLLSVFGHPVVGPPNSGPIKDSNQLPGNIASRTGSTADCTYKNINKEEEIEFNLPSASPIASTSNDHEQRVGGEVLNCHSCTMTFTEKNDLLHHLISSHKKPSRRSKNGTSVSEGVLMRDGKYECQFCHKVFQERIQYNGHVGAHVKSYVRSLESTPGVQVNGIGINNELSDGFSGGNLEPSSDAVTYNENDCESSSLLDQMDIKTDEEDEDNSNSEKIPDNSSLQPSKNEQTCNITKDTVEVFASTMEEPNKDVCLEVASLPQYNDEKTCGIENVSSKDLIFPMEDGQKLVGANEPKCSAIGDANGVLTCEVELNSASEGYNSTMEESKPNDVDNHGKNEIEVVENNVTGLSFCIMEETPQEKGSASSLLTRSGDELMCGVDNNVNEISKIEEPTVNEAKDTRNSEVTNNFSSNHNGLDLDLENNLDRIRSGIMWEESGLDEAEMPGNNELMISFGNSHVPLDADGVSEFIWRSEEENVQQGVLANSSGTPVQSSGCFNTFDFFSHKGETDLFNLNEKFENIPSFPGNVEFNFLNAHNSNSIPVDSSKVMPYNVQMEQGFDSSVWMEKDSSLPNKVPTICVWCQNQFHRESVNPETETSSIGFMCPTCNSKISGQHIL